jgi:hypothetical protein
MKSIRLIFLLPLLFFVSSCTDLTENIFDGVVPSQDAVSIPLLLNDTYNRLQTFQTQDQVWALQAHPSDETLGPTRGTDWDDNGNWRALHEHTWTSEHSIIRNSFNALGRGLYQANNILAYNPTPAQAAEARFLRALFVFYINDMWGSVPMRQPGEDIASSDPTVMSPEEAINFVISELEAVIPDLPDGVPAYQASKNAARAYLAKAYINKGVQSKLDRTTPSFDAGDMNMVIKYCDDIMNSGQYSIETDFYDNFRPDNDMVSSENIFTSKDDPNGNCHSRWFMTLHYNQNPSGWNGFCTIADFYDKFTDPNDVRWSAEPSDLTPVSGLKAGFLVGQQVDENGASLMDRKGNPLAFTKEVKTFETENNLEITGVRVIKYLPDWSNLNTAANDYVLIRYSDVVLMKAEAIARGGTATMGHSAASLVNDIRSARNTTTNSDGSLTSIYNERGFELYWEGWRRNDQIRFSTFLDAWTGKAVSESYRMLFPYPDIELAASPNLQQNPGY